MKILLISPLGVVVNEGIRYGGIERLVYEFARELVKTHDVAVMGHSDSVYPSRVNLFSTKPNAGDIYLRDEIQQYQSYQQTLQYFDVIHDFSHQHLASRYNPTLPSLNLFWHDPGIALFPKAPYNIIAPSKWAATRFKQFYKQDAKYQQSIIIDTKTYRPNGGRSNRFLSLGVIHPRKGHLEALRYCEEAGVPLDIVGPPGQDSRYCELVKESANKPPNRFLGEINDKEKLCLYQRCKALIYPSQEAEVTNHKLQEAMLCGAPVIVSNIGAMPELVAQGIDGFLCNSDTDFVKAIGGVDNLNPGQTHDILVETYSPEKVVGNYLELYRKVSEGLRW